MNDYDVSFELCLIIALERLALAGDKKLLLVSELDFYLLS
jgi:hypothetical protein